MAIINGSSYNDWLIGTAENDTIDGGAGDDELVGMDGADTYVMSSGGGHDRVIDYGAPWDADTVSVQGLDASQVRLAVDMATGDLLIRAASGEEMRIVGQNTGTGIEQIVFADGTTWGPQEIANATLEYRGTDGNDVLVGTMHSDWMDGGAGDDELHGMDGSDTYVMSSGGGNDRVVDYGAPWDVDTVSVQGLDASQVRLAVDMATGDLLIRAASGEEMRIVGQNTGTGIEQIVFADGTIWGKLEIANATFEYRGTDGNDVFVGTSGGDWMDGGAGDDELHGMDGSDTYVMSSGGGNDRVVDYGAPWDVDTVSVQGFDASQVRLIGDMATGDLLIRAASGEEMRIVGQNTGMGIEQIVFADGTIWGKLEIANATLEYRGTDGNDVLVGTSGGDWMDGGAGDDQLVGDSGNDVLIGGAGADVLQGGEGSDTYEVDQVGDVVIETDANAATGGVDTVNSYLSAYTLGANVENGAIVMSGNANLMGNALNNVIEAGAFNNVIDGGKGIDTASYAAAGAGVSVSLSTTKAQVTSGSGTDTLLRVENLAGSAFGDKLTGSSVSNLIEGGAGNDYLAGLGGSDSLSGGTGEDVLIGGVGADRLTGGQGRDVFDFNAVTETGTTSTSWDLITDFESGIDRLDLSSLDANQATSANDGFSQMLAAGASFTQAGQLMYSNGVLYGNTDGDAAAEFAIGLSAAPELTMSDIVL